MALLIINIKENLQGNLESGDIFHNFGTNVKIKSMKQFRDSRYWVSEDGEVFKYHPPRKHGVVNGVDYGVERWYKMKPTLRKNGYLVFNLQCPSLTDKGYFNTSVHQIVTECYLGPCPAGYEVDHIDENKQNNHISNLQYLTKEENILKSAKQVSDTLPPSYENEKRWKYRLEYNRNRRAKLRNP